jgi:hypothetical protein
MPEPLLLPSSVERVGSVISAQRVVTIRLQPDDDDPPTFITQRELKAFTRSRGAAEGHTGERPG